MLRCPTKIGAWLGGVIGFAPGALVGILAAVHGPASGIVGGLMLGGFLAAVGMFIGAAGAGLYNLAADVIDPPPAPLDGPEADYHDLPRSGPSPDRPS